LNTEATIVLNTRHNKNITFTICSRRWPHWPPNTHRTLSGDVP